MSTLPPTDADVARMQARLFAAIPTAERRRRKATLVATATAFFLVAGATTAGAVAQSLASIDARNTSFDCYTSTDVTSAHGTSIYADDNRDTSQLSTIADRVAFAVETCEAGYTATPTNSEQKEPVIEVPNPTACQLGDGRLAVFPNRDDLNAEKFCTSLALIPPTG